MPAWAAKQQAFVYMTNRNGPYEIWLHKPGQQDHPVVTPRDFPPDTTDEFMTPSLSPDGDRVIYSRVEQSGPTRLWMSSVNGGTPVRVTKGDYLQETAGGWSPDGAWFAYVLFQDGRGALMKVRTSGQGSPEVLTTDVDPDALQVPLWSPSGEGILNPGKGLTMVSPDGKTTRTIMERAPDAYGFSPDGKLIYGIRRSSTGDKAELFSINSSGGGEKVIGSFSAEYIPFNDLSPSLFLSPAPDGKSLAYSIQRSTANLWLMDGLEGVPLP